MKYLEIDYASIIQILIVIKFKFTEYFKIYSNFRYINLEI